MLLIYSGKAINKVKGRPRNLVCNQDIWQRNFKTCRQKSIKAKPLPGSTPQIG